MKIVTLICSVAVLFSTGCSKPSAVVAPVAPEAVASSVAPSTPEVVSPTPVLASGTGTGLGAVPAP